MKCSNYGQLGHNVRSCKGPINPNRKVQKKRLRPSTSFEGPSQQVERFACVNQQGRSFKSPNQQVGSSIGLNQQDRSFGDLAQQIGRPVGPNQQGRSFRGLT